MLMRSEIIFSICIMFEKSEIILLFSASPVRFAFSFNSVCPCKAATFEAIDANGPSLCGHSVFGDRIEAKEAETEGDK